jgi:hypothetical protein
MTAYQQIQKRMRENERDVLRRVRKANRRGALFQFWYGHGVGGNGHDRALSNALSRLIEQGRVVSLSRRGRYGHGYKIPTARAPKTGWKLVDSFGRLPGDRYYMG